MRNINQLSEKVKAVYKFLLSKGDFVSPTEVGGFIYTNYRTGSGHSSTGSPFCKKLVELGLAERNGKGHYKAISK